ncbi:hypothetical protein QZH41_003358 [Actinostola sp. cb2023]|nr:hypothetical protein QZH41_003358 [Actinostola sp. cb2023]
MNALCDTKPTEESRQSRIHDGKLSKEDHFSATGEHNTEYDHDAFLGSEKKEFDKRKPEESKKWLAKIVDRIDKNKDGIITRDELKAWIRYAGKRWLYDDSDRLWTHIKNLDTHQSFRIKGDSVSTLDPNTPIHWDLWKQDSFGNEVSADTLVQREFKNDKEKEEHIRNEREKFHANMDKDKDGQLNKKEMKEYVFPDYDFAGAEADHLIYHADINKNKMLSKEEIMSNFNIFVGSSATEYGGVFKRKDEF